jgi:YVTN family beta-propeller protein
MAARLCNRRESCEYHAHLRVAHFGCEGTSMTTPAFTPVPRVRTCLLSLPPFLVVIASAAAQTPGTVPITPQVEQAAGPSAPATGNFFDNTKGNLVRHQLGHVQPIVAVGDWMFAPNNAGQRLTVTYLPANAIAYEIPTGPGITALAPRPYTVEGWAVDNVNGCVTVVDPILNQVHRTIPVGKEPYGIAIKSDGSRAYVTCAATNSVDVIDCATYSVVKSIPIPAVGPRGITIANNTVWLVPLFSGNNSVAKMTITPAIPFGQASSQVIVTPDTALGETELPDADLFAIPITASASTDVLDPSQTRRGLGTILLNVHARPGTNELWIPNTDALNRTIGAANFQGGQVVSNRITIVDTSTSVTTPPTIVDLDALVAAGAAQPAAIEFDAARNRAYVAAFGSDAIVVLSTATTPPTLVGRHTLVPVTQALPVTPFTPARCGPRGLSMSTNGNELFVFNGIDNSFSRVDLTVTTSTAPTAVALGYDPTPAAVKRGIGHLANASHSAGGTSSCMSCHVDGHFDMLTWNLSDFLDPAPTANPVFEKDNKGPMATQTLRGLFETGVLHWRGEQAGLDDFNQDGFVGLLKRAAPLTSAEFADVKAGTFSLVHPANPREPANRIYAGRLATGLDAFRRTLAVAGDSCASCHTLPLGSKNDVQLFTETSDPAGSGKAAQLRGVGDKLSAKVPVFPLSLSYPSPFIERTTNGWGLTHSGTIPSMRDFVNEFPGIVGANLVGELSEFVEAFDTGLAPATTFQQTLVPGVHSQAQFDSALLAIKARALAGDCDIVVGTAAPVGSIMVPVTMAWDHVLGLWQTGTSAAAFTDLQLRLVTFDANLIVTFYGQPLGTGRRFGVDRDMDDLLDNDEQSFTPFTWSHIVDPDSDGDGFLDGHEAKNWPTMNPRATTATSPDSTAPQFTSPAPVTIVYKTTTSAKLEFSTDEPTRAEILGSFDATRSPTAGSLDFNHTLLVRALPEGTSNNVTVQITDAAGNTNTQAVTIVTTAISDTIRVASIVPGLTAGVPTSVAVTLSGYLPGSTAGAGYAVEAFAHAEVPGSVALTSVTLAANPVTTNGSKVATFSFTIPSAVLAGAVGTRKLHFGVRSAVGTLFYIEAHDVLNFQTFTF